MTDLCSVLGVLVYNAGAEGLDALAGQLDGQLAHHAHRVAAQRQELHGQRVVSS